MMVSFFTRIIKAKREMILPKIQHVHLTFSGPSWNGKFESKVSLPWFLKTNLLPIFKVVPGPARSVRGHHLKAISLQAEKFWKKELNKSIRSTLISMHCQNQNNGAVIKWNLTC